MQEHLYRGPRLTHIEARPASPHCPCPFCGALGYKAPAPCAECGTCGYSSGQAPWYRHQPKLKWQVEHLSLELEYDRMSDGNTEESGDEIADL